MKLLVTSSTFPRWHGDSTPRFVQDLALLAARTWDVSVLAPHHPKSARHERMGPLVVHRFRYFAPSSLARLAYGGGMLPNARSSLLARAQVAPFFAASRSALRELVQSERFDLVHAHFLVPQGLVARLALPREMPLVLSVHGSDLFALRGRAATIVQRAVLERARIITVNSEAARAELTSRFPEQAKRVRLLPMGVDKTTFFPSGEPRKTNLVAFVGRLTEQKGVHVLLEAAKRLQPRVEIAIAGDGPERKALEERAKGLEVTFLGPLAADAVAALLRRATLAVVPSIRDEALGVVALEAMACGCPVVASRTGGLADLVGDRGWLAAPGDVDDLAAVLERCSKNHAARRERAEAALRFVDEHYALPRLESALAAIYDEAKQWE